MVWSPQRLEHNGYRFKADNTYALLRQGKLIITRGEAIPQCRQGLQWGFQKPTSINSDVSKMGLGSAQIVRTRRVYTRLRWTNRAYVVCCSFLAFWQIRNKSFMGRGDFSISFFRKNASRVRSRKSSYCSYDEKKLRKTEMVPSRKISVVIKAQCYGVSQRI